MLENRGTVSGTGGTVTVMCRVFSRVRKDREVNCDEDDYITYRIIDCYIHFETIVLRQL